MAWTTAEENRVATLEGLVDTMMETIELLATKLMLSQSTLILEKDIQDINDEITSIKSQIEVLQGIHGS